MKSVLENVKKELIDGKEFFNFIVQETEASKSALISILNTILDSSDDPIIEINLCNSFFTEKLEGCTILDFDVKSTTGVCSEIEVLFGVPYFYKLWLRECASHHIQIALQNGIKNDIRPYASIAFINGKLYPETEKIHMVFQYQEISLGFPLSENMKYHVIELGKIIDSDKNSVMTDIENIPREMFEK